jgi:hypothetical protein
MYVSKEAAKLGFNKLTPASRYCYSGNGPQIDSTKRSEPVMRFGRGVRPVLDNLVFDKSWGSVMEVPCTAVAL